MSEIPTHPVPILGFIIHEGAKYFAASDVRDAWDERDTEIRLLREFVEKHKNCDPACYRLLVRIQELGDERNDYRRRATTAEAENTRLRIDVLWLATEGTGHFGAPDEEDAGDHAVLSAVRKGRAEFSEPHWREHSEATQNESPLKHDVDCGCPECEANIARKGERDL